MSHKKYREEKNCLNCGTEVTGKFCPECGQENLQTRENFFHLVTHFISDYFHFDSKFFRSMVPLFIKPGFLTKEYWEGRRVHYIHPLRLFFFITIIFMISTSYFYGRFGDELKKRIVAMEVSPNLDSASLAGLNDTVRIYLEGRRDSVTVKELKEDTARAKRQVGKMHAGIDLVFGNLKYVTFFLLPIYALIFKLMYIRRKSFYVDHLVYAMHLQSFAYCVFSVTLLLPFIIPLGLTTLRQISILAILIYIGFSLHYLYRQQWWKTLLKSLFATILLGFTTGLVIMLLAVIDAVYMQ